MLLKRFLSRALAAFVPGGADPFEHFWKRALWGTPVNLSGLARFIEISVDWSIYNRKTIIDMKI